MNLAQFKSYDKKVLLNAITGSFSMHALAFVIPISAKFNRPICPLVFADLYFSTFVSFINYHL